MPVDPSTSAKGKLSSQGQRLLRLGRVREEMKRQGLAAYVASTPTNILYTTGFRSNFASTYWRMLDSAFAIVPADAETPIAVVVMDAEAGAAHVQSPESAIFQYPGWMELRSLAAVASAPAPELAGRPAQFRRHDQVAALKDAFRSLHLAGERVGADLTYLSVAGLDKLRESVEAQWIDFTDALYALRSIKDEYEIDALRRSTELLEIGFSQVVSAAGPGSTAEELAAEFYQGVRLAALGDPRYAGYTHAWAGIEVGPRPVRVDAEVNDGTLIKMDCGVAVDHYCGDGGRTFAFGSLDAEATQMYEVLREAQARAKELMTPGRPVADIFRVVEQHVRSHGYPSYTRGHFGHSVGLDSFTEEPPYISADEQSLLAPGMVMAIEAPFYGLANGCIQIEDLVLIGSDGPDVFNRLPTVLLQK